MLETLSEIDKSIFLFVNGNLANPITDFIMPVITNDWGLRVVYALAMVTLLITGKARLRWLVLFSAITLLLTDQISAGYLKPLIARVRPCHVLTDINLLVDCGGGYAMPSTHAANVFGQAALFSYHYRRAWWYLCLIAVLVALSRLFVGVHYPGDILAGAVLGAVIGLLLAVGFDRFHKRMPRRTAPPNVNEGTNAPDPIDRRDS
ncbi:MAG: phosphatase PAP2 family protein [Candidatus Zixiibacteriota bacterium]|nr:MAG: phosphatase PAP2 family protein [candidate division Zixibacteria bacterium]